jgi:hypothetical protein
MPRNGERYPIRRSRAEDHRPRAKACRGRQSKPRRAAAGRPSLRSVPGRRSGAPKAEQFRAGRVLVSSALVARPPSAPIAPASKSPHRRGVFLSQLSRELMPRIAPERHLGATVIARLIRPHIPSAPVLPRGRAQHSRGAFFWVGLKEERSGSGQATGGFRPAFNSCPKPDRTSRQSLRRRMRLVMPQGRCPGASRAGPAEIGRAGAQAERKASLVIFGNERSRPGPFSFLKCSDGRVPSKSHG